MRLPGASAGLLDALLALALTAVALVWASIWPEAAHLDGRGAALAVAATLPLAVRRRWPVPVLALHVAASVPYHTLDYPHDALMVPGVVALYTVASTGDRVRSLVASGATCLVVTAVRAVDDGFLGVDALGTLGWLVAAIVLGEAVRSRQAYIAEIVDRAEHAERTREEEARRRVIEERLRIARDLHDLLAHSITLIQIQAGVAAHLIAEADGRADQSVIADSLDTITGTCGQARSELRATLDVLRYSVGGQGDRDPVPALSRLTELARPVRACGIEVTFRDSGSRRPLPPAVEIAAYRIAQESLTNVVKHSGASHVTVDLDYGAGMVRLTIADDGQGAATTTVGHGVIGMVERARSIGGRLSVESSPAGGFVVTAELPAGDQS